jgi:hypothetical protein
VLKAVARKKNEVKRKNRLKQQEELKTKEGEQAAQKVPNKSSKK